MIMLRILKRIGYILAGFVGIILLGLVILKGTTKLSPPLTPDTGVTNLHRERIADGVFRIGNNYLNKNRDGLYELFCEGTPFERGVITGKLTKELIHDQETYFINQIQEIIPSKIYLRFLRYFIAWFNRNLDHHINQEYLLEIYGISLSASDDFNFISKPYGRLLNYHAAHDIGHALQELNLVGCTSFGAWDSKSSDSALIIGRNFDFYAGDDFAKNKIVAFINPENGHKFMMVSWGGMIGAVSGMNIKGLTVTINAAKSDFPGTAKTPITILTREILQYARNIEEAYEIAKRYDIFVSESIMVSSTEDNQTAIIEKTPERCALFRSDTNFIISTNHFQGELFTRDSLNQKDIGESSSFYRYQRVKELLDRHPVINVETASRILRDQRGINDADIGMGNEKAINQLIAHHSVIFKPSEKLVWISTNPYQLGEYIAYDLNEVFDNDTCTSGKIVFREDDLTIFADTFLTSRNFEKYMTFRQLKEKLGKTISAHRKGNWAPELTGRFIDSNPEYYVVYTLLGDFFAERKDYTEALKYYTLALQKEVTSPKEEEEILEKLERSRRKIKSQSRPK